MVVVSSAIALGSNLGDSLNILQGAVSALNCHPHIAVTACSSVYTTRPVGPPQPDYFNVCVLTKTDLAPEELLRTLLRIEADFGRVRRQRWGPRRLDLDLLLFDELVLTIPNLQIPHPRMNERAFVLVPLSEIAGDWKEPISGKTIAEIAAHVCNEGVERSLYSLQISEDTQN
jgi:2-amino-4-hydroxy-6-hydroxymethyldihydropteridine diphosphokinase